MDTFVSLHVFRHVVEIGSFVGAADQMQLSPAMVSKHVMHLERHLGTRLLIRTSRRVSLTDHGRLYFEKCRIALDGLDEAKFLLQGPLRTPKGVLRLCVPSWFSDGNLTPALAQYQQLYPNVVLDVKLNRHVAGSLDDETDLALQVIVTPVSAFPSQIKATRLRSVQFVLVAAPGYLNNYPPLCCPSDLKGHRYIAFPKSRETLEENVIFRNRGEVEISKLQVSFYANNVSLVCQAAVSGMGMALVPQEIAQPHLDNNRLVKVLDHYENDRHDIYALSARHRHLEPKIQSFTNFAVDYFGRWETGISA